jgi:hypothetical protein
MAVTYRFEIRAQRTDGGYNLMARGGAVYNTLEEALHQAGIDANLGGNIWTPVDVIEGAHHGYEYTAFGEEANPFARDDKRAAFEEPKVLVDNSVIEKAASILTKHFVLTDEDVADPTLPHTGEAKHVDATKAAKAEIAELV